MMGFRKMLETEIGFKKQQAEKIIDEILTERKPPVCPDKDKNIIDALRNRRNMRRIRRDGKRKK